MSEFPIFHELDLAAIDGRAWPSSGEKPVVVALHCSGADGGQWRKLAASLSPSFEVIAPDLIGSGASKAWHGLHDFTLADEAERVMAIVDDCRQPVHFVGHSYGGGVALRVAAARPGRIASLSLYEPSAFHLLKDSRHRVRGELVEIQTLARSVATGVVSGAYVAAAKTFVDYWNGAGAWDALRDDVRSALVRWLPIAPLHFHALLSDATPLAAVQLDCPVLVMRGEHALPPSRLVSDLVAEALSGEPPECLLGAGHMGPITHSGAVIDRISRHVRAAATGQHMSTHYELDAA